MPTPTQVNSEDIVDLKESNRRIVERLDRLVDAILESNRETSRLGAGLARLEERVDRSLSVAKWGGGILAAAVLATAPAVFGVYRDVTELKRDVAALARELAEVKQSVNAGFVRIESKIDRLSPPK